MKGQQHRLLTAENTLFSSPALSKTFTKLSVIIIDRTDFGVYRRNKREAIPIICPPEC
jgi:hypothetical protein